MQLSAAHFFSIALIVLFLFVEFDMADNLQRIAEQYFALEEHEKHIVERQIEQGQLLDDARRCLAM